MKNISFRNTNLPPGRTAGRVGFSWGASWGFLGASWGPPGDLLGASWAPPGSLLRASWGPPGGLLGASWGHRRIIIDAVGELIVMGVAAQADSLLLRSAKKILYYRGPLNRFFTIEVRQVDSLLLRSAKRILYY
jgi:hypothetical protein